MVRWIGVLAATLCLGFLVPGAGAIPPKKCTSVTVAGTSYVVTAHGVSCRYARRWVKRYLRHKKHPKRWTCTPPTGETNVRVNCHGATKPKNDPAYRYYYGIKS